MSGYDYGKKSNDGLKTCKNCGNLIPQNASYCPFCGSCLGETDKSFPAKNNKNKYLLFAAGAAIIIMCAILFRRISADPSDQYGRLDSTTMPTPIPTVVPVASTIIEPLDMLREIDNVMNDYIYVTLLMQADSGNLERPVDIVLTDAEKIRATVFASEPDGRLDSSFRVENGRLVRDAYVETGPSGNGMHGLSVSEEDVEDNCWNLFGTKAQWTELQTEVKCPLYDAVRYIDSSATYALIADAEVDTELSCESHKYKATKTDDGYIGEVEKFWGYWGTLERNPGLSNYMITYVLNLNDSSKYGMIISSIRISKIGDSDVQTESSDAMDLDAAMTEDTTPEVQNKPFYGVWCFASRDQQEAQRVADDLKQIGLDGQVYISSEWSNLIREKWYCVSAGACSAESEAEGVLSAAYNAGYSDAYIKYSGDYIG